ncbi:MAG: PQQ-binding-like beta-propeller repeat protein [Planctomycetota bacterium]|nr:PQQ-binding-like beta-propeller repeat protein [Planctomycetota bacterium]
MAFTGDATQIPISNIVQALYMNGQEGVLSVDDGIQRLNFRILKLGIRPLGSDAHDAEVLKRAVVKARLLTEAEFQNTISTWDRKTPYPGDYLLRRRLITREQVESEIRKQLEEVLLQAFATKDLRYEFKAGETWTDHELFDPDGLGSSLIYNVNGVLMESVRREDDWGRIHEEISSEHEIFAPTSSALSRRKPKDIEISDKTYRILCKQISGDKTIKGIVSDSPLSSYEANVGLFHLKTRGLIRSLESAEKEQLAEKLRRMMKTKEAIGLYQSIIADDPFNIRVRTQLISLLEKVNQQPELLMEHYRELVDHYEREDPEKALVYVRKTLELDPNHLPAYEKQFVLNAIEGNKDAALASVRALGKSVKSTGCYEEGVDTLLRVVEHYPDEPYLFHEIAGMFVALKKDDEAVTYLKTVASIYKGRGDRQRLRKTYELIAKLDPSESATLKRITAETKRVSAPRKKSLMKTAFLTGSVSAVLAVITYFALAEIASRQLFVEIQRAIGVFLKYEQYAFAKASIDDFEAAYPLSTQKRALLELRKAVERNEVEKRNEEHTKSEELSIDTYHVLQRAGGFIKKGRYEDAVTILSSSLKRLSSDDGAEEHESLRKKLKSKINSLRRYFSAAEKLEQEASATEQRGDIPGAIKVWKKLLKKYPYSPSARQALLPVRVLSTPPGATVYVDKKPLGKTPFVVHLPPGRASAIQVVRKGYRPQGAALDPLLKSLIGFHPEKGALWTVDHKGPSEGHPVTLGDRVFWANRNGNIFSADRDGQPYWRYTVEDHADVTGGLGLWKGLIYAGCFDGNLYVLDARSGALQGVPVRASPRALPIKTSPSRASSNGTVAVNCSGRALAGISLVTRMRTWIQRPTSDLIGPPQVDRETVYVFTADGRLLGFDHDTGRPRRPVSLRGRLTHVGAVTEGRAFFEVGGSAMHCVDLEDGKVIWTRGLRAGATAPPTVSVDSQAVIVPLSDETLLCLDSQTGQERWKVAVGHPIEAQGVIFRNKLYIGTRDGYIGRWDIADSATSRRMWMFETEGAKESPPRGIVARGLISQGRFLVTSEDGFLYCLTLD